MVALRPQPRLTQPPPSGRWRRRLVLCGAACLLGWQLAQHSDGEVFVGSSQAAEVRKASSSCVCRRAADAGKEDPFERLQKALNKGKAKTPEADDVKAKLPSSLVAEAPAADAAECVDCQPEFDEEDLKDARAAQKEEETMAPDPFEKIAKVIATSPQPGAMVTPDQLESVAKELDGSVNLQEVRLRPIDTKSTWTMGAPIPAGRIWEGTGALVVAIRRPG